MKREELIAELHKWCDEGRTDNASIILSVRYVKGIIAALTALQSEAGRVSVPREPTQAMGIAGAQCLRRDTDEGRHESYGRAIDCWSAMLSAAPAPAATTGTGEATGNPLLWNVHCMFQQAERDMGWQGQWRDLLAAIEQHLQRIGYGHAAPSPDAQVKHDDARGT